MLSGALFLVGPFNPKTLGRMRNRISNAGHILLHYREPVRFVFVINLWGG